MSTVYLVDGLVEDGLQGVPFKVGVFTDLELARTAVKRFIGHNNYEVTGTSFSVPRINGPYGMEQLSYHGPRYYLVTITPFPLNGINRPKEFQ